MSEVTVPINGVDLAAMRRALEPLGHRVVVWLEPEERQGLLYLPEENKEMPTRGVVVATGPGRATPDGSTRLPMTVQVGDRVLLGRWSGVELTYDRKPIRILYEDDILAILR